MNISYLKSSSSRNKTFFQIICLCFSLVFINCKTINKSIEYSQIKKPNTNLFNSLDYLVDINNYLIISYTLGVIIDNYTYEQKIDSYKSFNMMSPTGSITTIDCLAVVEQNNEVVARIYSTVWKEKSRFNGK